MKEKNLLYFSALIAVIALISLLSDFFLLLVHGFSQAVFEGNSTGKTILMLLWFFLLPLISVLFIKFNLSEKIKPHSKKFLAVFLLFAFLGFALGLIQFSLIGMEFNSLGPFATIAEHNGIIDWQASKLTHNHFPKVSLYALESFFGFNSDGSFDDGFPWHAFIPDAGLWAFVYLLIELIILVFGILFLNSKLKEISFFDFLVFLAGFLAVLISVLDGGIGSGAAMMAVFFFAVFFSRNYLKIENIHLSYLFPLIVLGFIGFADVVFPIELIGNNFYASSLIVFFGLIYYFVMLKKVGKLNFSILNILLALFFVASVLIAVEQYQEFAFGREIEPTYATLLSLEGKQEEGGIFVYGLPENLEKGKVDFEVSKFGEIIESDKAGWSYYALIKPERNFRTGELEVLLEEKFSNGAYLYVEQVFPSKKTESYKILWFSDVNSENFLRDEFLASKIIKRKDNQEENSTEIVVEERTPFLWQMASILSEIRSNGFTGKVLLVKT